MTAPLTSLHKLL